MSQIRLTSNISGCPTLIYPIWGCYTHFLCKEGTCHFYACLMEGIAGEKHCLAVAETFFVPEKNPVASHGSVLSACSGVPFET